MVHPVPDPTAQAGFSLVPSPLYTAEDDSQEDSSSSTSMNKTSTQPSLPCFHNRQDISSSISDINYVNGHRCSEASSGSLLNTEKYKKTHESPLNSLETEQVDRSPLEAVDGRKLNEHGVIQVTA